MDELDRIDRSIEIDATAEKVWGLVSRPGWWINSRTIVSNPDLRRDGGVAVLHDPAHGVFPIATERLDPPSYAAFRWLTTTDEGERAGTLVEFFVTERPGGVTLRVVESGFSGLAEERADWIKMREGNVEGWGVELEAFRAHHDPTTITRAVRVPGRADDVRTALPGWSGAEVEVTEDGDVALVVVRVTGFDDLEAAGAHWDAELAALVARSASVPVA